MSIKSQLQELIKKWRDEEDKALEEAQAMNEKLSRGETVTITSHTFGYHPPLSKWVAANELGEFLLKLPPERLEGDGKACFYCGQTIDSPPASSFHGELGMPVPFFHADGSGFLRWHHNACLLRRLGEIKEKPPMTTEEILESSKDNPPCEHGYPMVSLYGKDNLVCRRYAGLPEPPLFSGEEKK
jgi:hypothetical protein